MLLGAPRRSKRRLRRRTLAEAADQSFLRISSYLHEALIELSPSAETRSGRGGEWILRIGDAELKLAEPQRRDRSAAWGDWSSPSFDVIAFASLDLGFVRSDRRTYAGRSHSLWFGDIQEPNAYGWFESAFMWSPLIGRSAPKEPFALDPGEAAAKAVWTGMAEYQVAWPFTPLVFGQLDDFIGRWAGWVGDAASGHLAHPHQMPEIAPHGSWRR